MPINKDLQDSAIRHSILMTRVASGVSLKMLALLNQSEARLVETMHRLDPDQVSTRFKRARIERMLGTIRDQQAQLNKTFKRTLRDETDDVAVNEQRFTKKQLTEAAGASFTRGFDFVSQARVQAAATTRPFKSVHLQWATQGDHVDEMFRRRLGLVEAEIKRGFVEGASTPEIVNRVRGTARQKFSDGILAISRRGAETMVRTAVNHTANATRQVIFEANDDLISGVRYVAILDGRTTPICMGLDGKIFPIRSGPRPPQHPACRSTTVEILKGEETPEYESYNDWLKTQPKPFVQDVLGQKKAKLYLDGNLTLDKFTDKKGATLTLDQLRVKENKAWKAAGLDGAPKPKTKAVTQAQLEGLLGADRTAAAEVAEAVGSFERVLVVKGKVSEQFQGRMKASWNEIPQATREKLDVAGLKVTLTEKLSRHDKVVAKLRPRGWRKGSTYSEVPGFFEPRNGNVVLMEKVIVPRREFVRRRGKFVATKVRRLEPTNVALMEDTLKHEVGHALDDLVHVPGQNDWANTEAFRRAYDADVAKMNDQVKERLQYFTQPGQAGPSEAFAEGFMELMHDRAGTNSHVLRTSVEFWKTHFPEVHKEIGRVVDLIDEADLGRFTAAVQPGGT